MNINLFNKLPGIIILICFCIFNTNAQIHNAMTNQKNLLNCDTTTGACEINKEKQDKKTLEASFNLTTPIKIIYFTDPICSSCWGIEPQLRKLKLTYGDNIEIEYKMGGLLKDWSYNSGGISKPSDVAKHWDEVSIHYDMPIDGDVWLEDPLDSSYPPSIAFKAAQIQSPKKAIEFLRALRELLFLKKKNITKWTYIEHAAQKVGLDINKLRNDFEETAKNLFNDDLSLAHNMRVRGFPTIFILDDSNKHQLVYGTKPYEVYKYAIEKVNPKLRPYKYEHTWKFLFDHYPTLTLKEFMVLANVKRENALFQLDKLVSIGKLSKLSTKNGDLYIKE